MVQKAAVGSFVDVTNGPALTPAQVDAIARSMIACLSRDTRPQNPWVVPESSLMAVANRIQEIGETEDFYAAIQPTADNLLSTLLGTDTEDANRTKLLGAPHPERLSNDALLAPYGAETFTMTESEKIWPDGTTSRGGPHMVTLYWAQDDSIHVVDGATDSELRFSPAGHPGRLCWSGGERDIINDRGRVIRTERGTRCVRSLHDRNTVGRSRRSEMPACNQ